MRGDAYVAPHRGSAGGTRRYTAFAHWSSVAAVAATESSTRVSWPAYAAMKQARAHVLRRRGIPCDQSHPVCSPVGEERGVHPHLLELVRDIGLASAAVSGGRW